MYKKLEINFPIPQILEKDIEDFLFNLNNKNGNLADCYEEEIRNVLNGCEFDLTDEQITQLRNYYCKGGIYESDN